MSFERRHPRPQPSVAQQAELLADHPPTIESYRPGYPRLSAFMNSDKDFVVFRRFGQLHARILLHKQDAIIEIEQKLNAVDKNDKIGFSLRSRREDKNVSRHELLAELEPRLLEYDALLETYYRQIERPQIQERNAKSLTYWIKDNKPLVYSESCFLNNWDDLVTPAPPTARTAIETAVETCAALLHNYGLLKIFTTYHDRMKSQDSSIIYITAHRVAGAARLLTSLLAVVLMVVPIVVLYYVNSMLARLQAIAVCGSCFALLISFISHARVIEIFSVTATYCTVLVVFLTYFPNL